MDHKEARGYLGTHHVYNQPKPAPHPHWWNKHPNTQPIQIMRQSSLTEAASSPGSASSPPASPMSPSGFSYPVSQNNLLKQSQTPQPPKVVKPVLTKQSSSLDDYSTVFT